MTGLERAPLVQSLRGWKNRGWGVFAREGQGPEEIRPPALPLGAQPASHPWLEAWTPRLPGAPRGGGARAIRLKPASPSLGPTTDPWDPPHSPAPPISGHQPLLLQGGPGTRARRRHFPLFPGCARTTHNPNKPRALASSASLPRPPARKAPARCYPSSAPTRGRPRRRRSARRRRAPSVDSLSNGVSERARRKGKRGAAPPYSAIRLVVGSRGNHSSLPGTAHLSSPACCKNCMEMGVAGLFTLLKLNCWDKGKEDKDSTRRR